MKYNKRYQLWASDKISIDVYGTDVNILVYEDTQLMLKYMNASKNETLIGFASEISEYDYLEGACIKTGIRQYLLVFDKKHLSVNTVVHECCHVRQYLMSSIGMYIDVCDSGTLSSALKEAEAYVEGYLCERVFNEIDKVIDDEK